MELERVEIDEVVTKLRVRRACGSSGMTAEVLKYGVVLPALSKIQSSNLPYSKPRLSIVFDDGLLMFSPVQD